MLDVNAAWSFLPWGYALSVLVEGAVLLVALSSRHSLRDRLIAGFWLTACTYPIVVLVLPPLIWEPWGRTWYLVVAEIFAPVAECILFRLAYGTSEDRKQNYRDYAAIVVANLASFGIGEVIYALVRT